MKKIIKIKNKNQNKKLDKREKILYNINMKKYDENNNKKGGEKMRETVEKIKEFVQEVKDFPVVSPRIKGLDWESRKDLLENSPIKFRIVPEIYSEDSQFLRVEVLGKTYPVKDIIKSYKFFWTGSHWEKDYNITGEKISAALNEIKTLIETVLKAAQEINNE